MQTDREARQLIVQIVSELFQSGHLTPTGGNVSALSPDGETLWITPSGLFKGALDEDSLVHIKSDGSVIEGTYKLEETAKLQLYMKQFGGQVSLIPDERVKKLAGFSDFV